MKLVDLSTAKALQELGYEGEYNYCWIETQHDGLQLMTQADCEKFRYEIIILCAAPRLDDAAYWLRDKHGWSIRLNYVRMPGWFGDILNINTGEYIDSDICQTYDSALEAAVKKAIEIIKTRSDERE